MLEYLRNQEINKVRARKEDLDLLIVVVVVVVVGVGVVVVVVVIVVSSLVSYFSFDFVAGLFPYNTVCHFQTTRDGEPQVRPTWGGKGHLGCGKASEWVGRGSIGMVMNTN